MKDSRSKKPTAAKRRVEPENSETESEQSSEEESLEKENELPYRNVRPLRPVVEVPAVPYRHMVAKREKNYRHEAPVEQDVNVERLVDRSLDLEVPVTLREMLAIAPGYRKVYKDKISRKRVPVQEVHTNAETSAEKSEKIQTVVSVNLNSLADAVAEKEHVYGEDGKEMQAWVIQDPIEKYLSSVLKDDRSNIVFTANESESLRVIPVVINGVIREEALLDNGSQIVSMCEAVARESQLAWDPDFTIHMQSANGEIEKSLGLAKNVPFRIGPVTLFLQVHIMCAPAYKVLLGQPFDVITRSEIKNDKMGG